MIENENPIKQIASAANTHRMLLLRTAATLVLAPITLALVWFGGQPLSALIAFLCILLVFEWVRIVDRAEFTRTFYILILTAILALFLAAEGYYFYGYLSAIVGGSIGAFFARRAGERARWSWLGAVYLICPCLALIWIRALPGQGLYLTMILLTAVWANDIGAYVIGKTVGGARLVPRISPGKTWAGTIGGVVVAAVMCAVLGAVGLLGPQSSVELAFVGVALAIVSTVGDITESAWKRNFGIKDSGGYIPGHGGVLDRLDGMIFATVAMALALYVYSAI